MKKKIFAALLLLIIALAFKQNAEALFGRQGFVGDVVEGAAIGAADVAEGAVDTAADVATFGHYGYERPYYNEDRGYYNENEGDYEQEYNRGPGYGRGYTGRGYTR